MRNFLHLSVLAALRGMLLVACFSLSIQIASAAPKRVALVIGNGAYKEAPLRNPVNDARAMAKALRELGFEVIERTDTTQRELSRAVTDFGEKLGSDSVALFFYAGHGIQVRGKNYLIPVDARISSEPSIRSEAVDVDIVLEQIATTGSGLNFVILDACRNNPFERRFRSGGGAGLAQMDAPKGTFIAYATAPGKVASDGDGDNGLYTQELLKTLATPGLKVEEVFKRVRVEVARASNDIQLPWESSSLTGDFYFKAPVPVVAKAPVPVGTDAVTLELELWKSAQQLDAAEAYQAYLDVYPGGRYAKLARIGIAKVGRQNKANANSEAAMQAALTEANARAKAAEQAAQSAAALVRLATANDRSESDKRTEAALRAEIEKANARATAAEEAAKAAQLSPLVDAGKQLPLLALAAPDGSGKASLARGLDQPHEGDEWVYRFTDKWKNQTVTDYRIRLESVTPEAIKEKIEYIDTRDLAPGAKILRARWVDRDEIASQLTAITFPNAAHKEFSITEWLPYAVIPTSLKKGHTWDGPFMIDGEVCAGTAELGKEESIDVPAGTFRARRIELVCQRDSPILARSPGDTTRLIRLQIWFAAGLYRPLRIEKLIKGNIRDFDKDVIELVEFRRATSQSEKP